MSDAARCCAEFYEKDWVAAMMGDSFHPGGLELSCRLAHSLGLGPEDRVLDVASGTGASAAMLARGFGCQVVGMDLSARNVERATANHDASLPLEFRAGDATRLPFEDERFDAVVCECAFSTFQDKDTVASELARVMAGALAELDLDVPSARALLDQARDLVRAGDIQYCRLTFSLGRARLPAEPAATNVACDPSTGCC